MRRVLPLGLLAALLEWALVNAAGSPLLAWRDPVYIAGSFIAVLAMGALIAQPLSTAGAVPVRLRTARRLHRAVGGLAVLGVILHVAALWLTSPPDVVDALLFRSPAPFSIWGVLALWALVATAALGALRVAGRLRWRAWRALHAGLALVFVGGTVAHVLLIDGVLGLPAKLALCAALVGAALWAGFRARNGAFRA